jgi:hypothetical protein
MRDRRYFGAVQAAVLILLVVVQSPRLAGDTSSRAVVEAFFSPKGIVEKSKVYKGEMLKFASTPTMGEYLGADASKEYRVLSETDNSSVYGVTVRTKANVQDWYAFVANDSGVWKLAAVRTLAQTGLIATVVANLSRQTGRTAEQEWTLKNSQLTLSSDSELKQYLRVNLAQFDSLANSIRSHRADEATAARNLLLSTTRLETSGMITLTVGGILDNTVGFLNVPDTIQPPSMDPSGFIYVEHAVNRWYVFKTT